MDIAHCDFCSGHSNEWNCDGNGKLSRESAELAALLDASRKEGIAQGRNEMLKNLPERLQQDIGDGDRICEAAGLKRDESGNLPLDQIIALLRKGVA